MLFVEKTRILGTNSASDPGAADGRAGAVADVAAYFPRRTKTRS